ncbi:MMPL family transporter [Glycomyces xiaoerkulensis]|uniref:MMPL family transporter n=1 Tax=Glycomyces xiaoerkulensis TaxID=2038139 RepID=UPI000DEEA515|nr:MMPL family transporter [Glycomyces xiaoerkulensis]
MRTVNRWAIHRPWTAVLGWIVLALIAAPLAMQLGGALKAGGFSDPRAGSVEAQETLEEAFDQKPNSLMVVLSTDGDATAAVPDASEAATDMGADLVVDHRMQPGWVADDGGTTMVVLGFDEDNTTVQSLVPELETEIDRAVGDGVTVEITGAPALDAALNHHSEQDAARAELIAFPVLFVVLLLVFRSVAAMLVPLAMAGITLAITQAAGFGFTEITDVNSLFVNIVTMIGLAVAVDYSLFIIKRFREELESELPVKDALEKTMATVGHSVMFAGLAVMVSMAALFIPRTMAFTSIALAGALVTAVAVSMSMTLLPAVLSLLGRRINWGSIGRRKRREAPEPKTRLMRRPGLVLAALVVAFAALAAPALNLTWQVPVASASILPGDDGARTGLERVENEIGLEGLFPVEVVLTAPEAAAGDLSRAADDVAAEAATIDGVVDARVDYGEPAGGELAALVSVTTEHDPDSDAAHAVVDDLRGIVDGLDGDVTARLGGATATGDDFDDLVLRSMPLVVAAVAVLSLILLTVSFRTWLMPLLALAFNAMVVAASLGVLALISADGSGTINSVTPLMLFAVMFGLSMDYMVIMISRMKELYTDGLGHREAVMGGLARTAGLVNGAAVIMVAVFVSFTSAQISIVRELGIVLAVAVVLDAVVIRRLVMPATLLIVGDRVWGRGRRTEEVEPVRELAGAGAKGAW